MQTAFMQKGYLFIIAAVLTQGMQRVIHNGHRRVHVIKFQSVITPNEIKAKLYGPVDRCRHDSDMLSCSGLLQQLEQDSYNRYEEPMCLYGNPAYPLRVYLQETFANPTPEQPKYNKTMSQPRVAIERAFGNNSNFFAFLGFKGTSKLISVQLERCTLAVHSCKILEVAYIDVQL